MEYLTIMQAARRSGKSDKTIRRAIHKGLLAAHFPQPNRCEIAERDLDLFLHGQVSGQPESVQEPRIAELEGRVQALEAQVQRLLEHPKALRAPRVTSPRERQAGLLPRHLVPLFPFAQMHQVSETSVHAASEMGLLPVKRGSWTRKDSTLCTNSTMTCLPLWPVISVLTGHLDSVSRHSQRRAASKQAPAIWRERV